MTAQYTPEKNPQRRLQIASYCYAIFFACLAAVCIAMGSGLAPIILSDSMGYIDFSAQRAALYPMFIMSLGSDLDLVVYFQFAVYIATFSWLIYTLHQRFNSHLISACFGFALSCNPFMWSYHAAIMTESLTFSSVNVLLIALINMTNRERRNYLTWVCLAGLSVGVLVGLRPAMWSLAPSIGLVAWLYSQHRKAALSAIAGLVVSIAAVMALESLGYYAKHSERSSILPNLLYGRAAMLTTEPAFIMPDLPPDQQNILKQTALFTEPTKNYLHSDEIPPLLRHSLLTTIETFMQWEALPYLIDQGLVEQPSDIEADKEQVGIAAITENPLLYLRLSSEYYLRLWSGGAVRYTIARYYDDLPNFEPAELNHYLAKMMGLAYSGQHNSFLLWIIFGATASLGVACFLLSVWSWGKVAISAAKGRQPLTPRVALIAALLLISQSNLIFVSMVTCTGLRYLLPVFPLLVLSCLLWLQMVLADKRYPIAYQTLRIVRKALPRKSFSNYG